MSDTPDEWFPPCSSLVDSLHSIANKLPHVDKMRVRDAAESVQQLELEITDLRRQIESIPSDIRTATAKLMEQAGQLAELRSQLEEAR